MATKKAARAKPSKAKPAAKKPAAKTKSVAKPKFAAKTAAAKPAAKPAAAKPAAKPAAAKPAKLRAWKVASGGSAYQQFVCGGHLLWWTGSKLSSVEIATGKLVAKVNADQGAPFAVGNEVFVPTTKGFTVHKPTLAVARQIETPLPKSPSGGKLRFISGVARVCGEIAVRVAQSTQVTNVDGSAQQDYFLCGFDVKSKRSLFLTLLASTSAPQVGGDCVADRFAITFESGNRTIFGSLPQGTILGTKQGNYSSIIAVGDHLVDEPVSNNKFNAGVLVGDTWKPVPCQGVVIALGERIYCVGHNEVAVLDESFEVTARAKIEFPAPGERHMFLMPQSSACLSGDALLVIECTKGRPESLRDFNNPVSYRATWRDPVTLAERRTTTFDEVFALGLVGESDGIHVAEIINGFVGLRL